MISLQAFLEKNTEELQQYKTHSDNYICSLIPGTSSSQAQYTPGGVNVISYYKEKKNDS